VDPADTLRKRLGYLTDIICRRPPVRPKLSLYLGSDFTGKLEKGSLLQSPTHFIHPDRFEYLARMVNYNDPIVLSRDFCTHTFPRTLEHIEPVCLSVAMVKFWHVIDGLYMYGHFSARAPRFHVTPPSISSWEFITTLDYEWSFIRGRHPYRWTILVCTNEYFWVSLSTNFVWHSSTPLRASPHFWPS